MKSVAKTLLLTSAACSTIFAAGCNSLPWSRKEPAGRMTAQQYAEQEPVDIQYDTSANPTADVDSPSQIRSPSDTSAARTSVGAGSSVSGSCCH